MNDEELRAELCSARERIRQLEDEHEALRREMRLVKLRRQVTPHFLFNSISVGVSLAIQSPKAAARFFRLLAQMYRYLLKYGNEYSVPVEQEVEMLMQYYELMGLRHVDSIDMKVSKAVFALRGYPLPPLSLQGLLENAIRHNIHTEAEPLSVSVDCADGFLTVTNRMKPLLTATESTNMGLAYMNETMMLLFHRQVEVEDDGSTFTVKLPLVEV